MAAAVGRHRHVDRRQFERLVLADRAGAVRARVRPGRDVRLIEFSRGGALVQATSRLLPGSEVELQVTAGDAHWSAKALVVRCRVWALSCEERVRYRAAIQFAKPLDQACQAHVEKALQARAPAPEGGYEMPATGSPNPS